MTQVLMKLMNCWFESFQWIFRFVQWC